MTAVLIFADGKRVGMQPIQRETRKATVRGIIRYALSTNMPVVRVEEGMTGKLLWRRPGC